MTGSLATVLQVAGWYPPYQIGGTEVYLSGLVSELAQRGIKSTVLIPRSSNAPERYEYLGASVETYPVNEAPVTNELRAGTPHQGFKEFCARLLKHRTSIYHQHSWTRGCGPNHLRAARELGFRTVLTVHVPGNICLRGTMLRFGQAACEGRLEEKVCGACWAQGRGAPKLLSQTLASLPLNLAKRARLVESRLATALSARALAAERLGDIAEMIRNSDRIVAVCEWLYDVLEANGVSKDKLLLSRQGVSDDYLHAARAAAETRSASDGPLKLLFLGRCAPVKGIEVLVHAIRSLPSDMAVHLAIRAFPAAPDARAYEASVRALALSDSRICIEAPVCRSELASVLSGYDALVVPSLWLETGPLVVLEAQAVGLFVLGSRLGGIAELVDESDTGELVEAGNVPAWAAAIKRLEVRRRHNAWLRPISRHVRTMSVVASEMADLYGSLTAL
jgi:glycosyltransferase involved in cell wall biosynthesis